VRACAKQGERRNMCFCVGRASIVSMIPSLSGRSRAQGSFLVPTHEFARGHPVPPPIDIPVRHGPRSSWPPRPAGGGVCSRALRRSTARPTSSRRVQRSPHQLCGGWGRKKGEQEADDRRHSLFVYWECISRNHLLFKD
jgi:hypothetical protein